MVKTVSGMDTHLRFSSLGELYWPHVDCSCTGESSQLEGPQTATPVSGSSMAPLYNIRFSSPDIEQDTWDFLLFSPSRQHTAALCLQREPARAPRDVSSSGSIDSCDLPSGSKDESKCSEASDEQLSDSSCSTASSNSVALKGNSETTAMQDRGTQERQCSWRLQCWRTVPLMYDECVDPSEVLVQGYSFT